MQIIESLEKIAEAIEKSNIPDRLWTIEDISTYIGYHINFVYQLKDKPIDPAECLAAIAVHRLQN